MDNGRDRKRNKRRDDESPNKEKPKKRRSRSRSAEKRNYNDSRRKRRHSKSPEASVKIEKQPDNGTKHAEITIDAPERKKKDTDMLNTRTGGAYIPPARLRMMQAEITDKSSVAYQRLAWEALKKSIHGHINKINVGNIGIIIKELLKENIVRGRGLLCRSVIQAQAASPTFTNVYAALVAAVNSRFPNIGELLLKRLVIQFKRGFKRNDKPICISSASFIAHLVNQRVAHEILALELLTLLVETPTDDSVEVAIAFLKECGQKLTEVSSKGVNAIFEMLRNILHEGQLDKRVQYMIEVMFQVWKDGFKDHPALIEELELVPEEEQFTHLLMLDDATDAQDILNVFKFDEKYEENEQKYKTLSKEILGSDAESEEDGSGESGSDESDDEEGGDAEQKGGMTIIDNTETNLVALRRTIYLTINSSLDFEECAHKLMKMQLKPGQEVELCHMFLDCCAEQRTYEKFYGLLAQRFCNLNRMYIGPFEEIFKDSYSTAHRLDTNRLRNVSKFFAHLLFTDSISWEVLECVRLNEEDTTSSSRIYIKILFQELAEYMGLKKLNDRLKDPTLQDAFSGVFPRDNPKNTRFSINFFTSIGLGGLTDELREHLKQMPKNVPQPMTEIKVGSSSDSSSSSSSSESSSSSDDSDSSSEEERSKKKKDKGRKTEDKPLDEPCTSKSETLDKNKDNERWGHDGFYDTYGKNARRMERQEKDKDNFVIPRSVDSRPNREKDLIRNGNEKRRNHESEKRFDGRRRDNDIESRRREGENNRDQRNKYESINRRSENRRAIDDTRDKDNYRKRNDKYTKNSHRNRSSDEGDSGYNTKEKEMQKKDSEKGKSSDRKGNAEKSYEIEDTRRKNTSGNEDDGYHRRTDKQKKDAKRDHNKSSNTKELSNNSKRDAKDKYRQKDDVNQEMGGTPPLNDDGWDIHREKSVIRSDEWDIKKSSSLRRETVVRYWDSTETSQDRNRSARSSKSDDRRSDR